MYIEWSELTDLHSAPITPKCNQGDDFQARWPILGDAEAGVSYVLGGIDVVRASEGVGVLVYCIMGGLDCVCVKRGGGDWDGSSDNRGERVVGGVGVKGAGVPNYSPNVLASVAYFLLHPRAIEPVT